MLRSPLFWLFVIIAVVVLGGSWWALTPPAGETELQNAQEALKSVKSWRFAVVPDEESSFSEEGAWEVDCARGWHGKVRHSSSFSQSSYRRDYEYAQLNGSLYMREGDSDWNAAESEYMMESSPFANCSSLEKGTQQYPFPNLSQLVSSAVITPREKKTVSGMKCRVWHVQVMKLLHQREFDLCLGTRDHLPYEISGEGEQHIVFSDYNQPMEIRGPH